MTTQGALAALVSTDTRQLNRQSPQSTLRWTDISELDARLVSDGLGRIASDNDERRLDTSVDAPKPAPTLPLPRLTKVEGPRGLQVELLAEWNGCVTSIQSAGHYFSATLKGVLGQGVKGEEEEDATIPTTDVSESDKDLLHPGNFFRLCVMYEILPTGQPRRYTQVVFRRLPAYRQYDLDQAAERGRELGRGLRVE